MGCGIVRERKEEKVWVEPTPLQRAVKMKTYGMIAGMKVALRGDEYDEGRSEESLESDSVRRMEHWVGQLPPAVGGERQHSSDALPLSLPSTAPASPLYGHEPLPLPPCLHRSPGDLPNPPTPTRLYCASQLHTLNTSFKLVLPPIYGGPAVEEGEPPQESKPSSDGKKPATPELEPEAEAIFLPSSASGPLS
eukprot:TRINITY_DN3542_c2_g2_i1.p1 TRINITY_DN3542_c2_g2~~TRINITY_DN3542_c2_g2_i1.p1  ORF type:complete len:205 (+),score=50.05 TRINITY_DN3542_c2_g2_i1:39-617(+)